MQRVNVRQIAEIAASKNEPLLGDASKLSQYDFMTEYLADFDVFDEDIAGTRGFFYPLYNMQEAYELSPGQTDAQYKDDVLEHFRRRSATLIKKYKKEFEGFARIDEAEFNPIENYDRYENWEDKKQGTDTLKDSYDSVNTTYDIGAKSSSQNYGEQVVESQKGEQVNSESLGVLEKTLQKGAQTNNDNMGAQHKEGVGGIAGFNSTSFSDSNKAVEDLDAVQNSRTEGERTDKETQGAVQNSYTDGQRKDSQTMQEHKDTFAEEARQDVTNIGEREDTHEQSYDNTMTHAAHIHGNIGVTTATAMLEEAVDFYSRWNFYNKLYSIILGELCYWSDPGYDVL